MDCQRKIILHHAMFLAQYHASAVLEVRVALDSHHRHHVDHNKKTNVDNNPKV